MRTYKYLDTLILGFVVILTVLVVVIAFFGTISWGTMLRLILSAYFLKVAYETLATPLTYAIVGWLKRAEESDPYDTGANFNPFPAAKAVRLT